MTKGMSDGTYTGVVWSGAIAPGVSTVFCGFVLRAMGLMGL